MSFAKLCLQTDFLLMTFLFMFSNFSLFYIDLLRFDLNQTFFRSSRFSSQGAREGGTGQKAEGVAGGGQEKETRGAQAAREL